MKLRLFVGLGLLAPAITLGASPFTSLHPEEAHPDAEARVHSGPHSDLISQVQERLLALGFHAGPVNGDWGEKTQAALAQFQLSVNLPAGGQLDELTLAHLGVRDYPVAAGASAAPAADLVPAATPERPDEPKSD
jgi:peptidoglycan hydrolase-like protein with peptidoglycan-binding domain